MERLRLGIKGAKQVIWFSKEPGKCQAVESQSCFKEYFVVKGMKGLAGCELSRSLCLVNQWLQSMPTWTSPILTTFLMAAMK